MAAGSVTQKINISLPEDAVSSFVQRGADLVLVLANGEERVIRNVYSDPARASETQLVFDDGAVRDVPSMGLGDSFSTAEIFSTKTGVEGTSDPMVLPAMGAVTNFLGGNDAAAGAGLLGLGALLLLGDDDNDGNDLDAINDISSGAFEADQTIDVLANDVNADGVVGGEGVSIAIDTDPQNGTATVVGTGADQVIVFTPDAGFSGENTFTFHLMDRSHRLLAGPLQRLCSDLPPRNLKPPKGYGFRFRGGRSCATRHPRTRDFITDTTSCGRQSIDTRFCTAPCASGSGKSSSRPARNWVSIS